MTKTKPTYKTAQKKRTFKRTKPIRIRRSLLLKTHMFKRTFSTVYAVQDTLANRATIHMLSNLPNYTELTALFDQYKITAVKARFIFDMTASNIPNTTTQNTMPNLITVIDKNDGTALAAITDYEQYETMKVRRLDKQITIYFKPRVSSSLYSAGGFTGYAISPQVWVDTNSPSVEYYGLKYGINGNMEGGVGTNKIGAITIYWTYYIMCKCTK